MTLACAGEGLLAPCSPVTRPSLPPAPPPTAPRLLPPAAAPPWLRGLPGGTRQAQTGARAGQEHTRNLTPSGHGGDDYLCRSPRSPCRCPRAHPSRSRRTGSPPPHRVPLSGSVSAWRRRPWAKVAVRLSPPARLSPDPERSLYSAPVSRSIRTRAGKGPTLLSAVRLAVPFQPRRLWSRPSPLTSGPSKSLLGAFLPHLLRTNVANSSCRYHELLPGMARD